MPTLSYCLHQAQVCLSMARRTEDPNIKRRYEELAIDFMERAGGRRDAEVEVGTRKLTATVFTDLDS
jgi:hypothetical protein